MKTSEDFTPSSGNVFADLELPNAEELHTKTKLTLLIKRLIKQRGWTQQQAADALGIKQPDVSELSRGRRLEHYSVERLMHFLGRLEQRVTITVSSAELPTEEIVVTAYAVSGEQAVVSWVWLSRWSLSQSVPWYLPSSRGSSQKGRQNNQPHSPRRFHRSRHACQ